MSPLEANRSAGLKMRYRGVEQQAMLILNESDTLDIIYSQLWMAEHEKREVSMILLTPQLRPAVIRCMHKRTGMPLSELMQASQLIVDGIPLVFSRTQDAGAFLEVYGAIGSMLWSI